MGGLLVAWVVVEEGLEGAGGLRTPVAVSGHLQVPLERLGGFGAEVAVEGEVSTALLVEEPL
jgi:hypothetical protein